MIFQKQVKRILHFELPPRQFWAWWCGGLAVYDALIVLAWAVVNVVYVQQRVVLILPLFKSERPVLRTYIVCSIVIWSLCSIGKPDECQKCVVAGWLLFGMHCCADVL